MNNTKFYINTFKLQKSIDAIVLAMENSFKDIQSSLDVLKKLFYEEDDWLATKKYLDNLSLKELEEIFDYKHMSKTPAVFDMNKIKWMNGEYIKAMDFDRFKELAMPYVTETIHREMDFDKILSMVKTRIELFTEIPGHIDFFEAVPEYDVEMYKHKKMKTTPETSLTVLKEIYPVIEAQEQNHD